MIPIDQTCFDIPGGNCFQAALASVLELSLEEVPDFCNLGRGDEWEDGLNRWLLKMFGMFSVNLLTPVSVPCEVTGIAVVLAACRRCWINENGNSQPAMHAVVYGGGRIVHDPHPSREHMSSDVLELRVFCAVDPAKAVRALVKGGPA